MFWVTIKSDRPQEVQRLLHRVLMHLRRGKTEGKLLDIDGKTEIGYWSLNEKEGGK